MLRRAVLRRAEKTIGFDRCLVKTIGFDSTESKGNGRGRARGKGKGRADSASKR